MELKRRMVTLRTKQLTAFILIILVIMGISLGLHANTAKTMRQMTYEKMKSQGDYYQNLLDQEIDHVRQQQIEFINNRKLFFIANPKLQQEPYEKRDALLSMREKLGDMTAPDIVEDAVLYLPQSGYKISPGGVRSMNEESHEEMDAYSSYHEGTLNYDGTTFFSKRIIALGNQSRENPSVLSVVKLSSEELRKQLDRLVSSAGGGAAYYHEDLNVLLKGETADETADQILKKLKKDEQGRYQEVSEIRLDSGTYLVFVGERSNLGVLIQYAEEKPIMEYIKQSWRNMILFMIIMASMAVVFIWYNNKIIHKPMHILLKAFKRVREGNLREKIHHEEKDEFAYLYQGFNTMEERVLQLLNEVSEQADLAQKAQLKQLQAQINPHFLYNSYFILSRRIKGNDYENAEEFAKHLGNYFKYLARDGADYIPIEQETEHAKSYAAIQGARFSNRISVRFGDVPETCLGLLVPRLILQPLLENAFKYGLEDKVADGLLRVTFAKRNEDLSICVEDNGETVSDEDILKMQNSLKNEKPEEITGIMNIHRRLKIYYKEKSGLTIVRSQLGGVAVTIVIPYGEETKA